MVLRYRLPLKKKLSFNRVREGLILQLERAGRFGYGEIAPLPGFSVESLDQSQAQLALFCSALNCHRITIDEDLQLNDAEVVIGPFLPSVAFGIESALWWLQQSQWFKSPNSAPLLQGTTSDILQRLRHFSGSWPREFKLKTGRDSITQDIARIDETLRLLPENVLLKLDANQRWTFSQVLHLANAVDTRRISYIEEPTANAEEFSEIFAKTGFRFALDETIQRPNYQFTPMRGLAALIIKPTLVGSLNRCHQLMAAASSAQTRTILSSSYESAIGLQILKQLSVQWSPEELHGLDTGLVFKKALIEGSMIAGNPILFTKDCVEKIVL